MADSTQVTITRPPEFLQDYYAALAQRGMNLGNQAFTPYTQDRVAPWNQQMNQAAQMIQQRAIQGSPVTGQAQNWWENLMGGQMNITPQTNPYMGQNNPYLQNTINQAAGDITSRIDSKFNNNAFGGTAHQQTLARELGNLENQMRMADYGQQMGLQESNIGRQAAAQQQNVANQMQGLGMAPQLAQADYQDASALMGLGSQLQGYNQQIADANYQEFQRQQAWPGQQLAYMQAGLNPAKDVFSNTQGTTMNPSSGLASAVGGAATGYGLASAFPNSGISPWVGAALGGLTGLMGR